MGVSEPLLLLLLAAPELPAADSVRLHLAECVPSRDLVHDLVAIELGLGRVIEAAAAIEVRTACTDEVLRIYITRDQKMRPGARELVVQDIAERRIGRDDLATEGAARLVALNIAELVNDLPATRRPLSSDPSSASDPGGVSAEAAVTSSAPVSGATAVRVGAAPSVRFLPRPARVAAGAQVSVGVDGRSDAAWRWSLHVDAGAHTSEGDVPLGALRTRVLTAGVFGGLAIELVENLAAFVFGGVRAGWVWLDGLAGQDDVAQSGGSGAWFGPAALARLRYGDRIGVSLGVETGWITSGVYGGAGGDRVGLVDGWVGGDVALDWRFGGSP